MKNFFRFLLLLLLVTASWQFGRSYFTYQEREIRSDIRENIEKQFSEMATDSNQRFGLKQLHGTNAAAPNIVLIHGLDDPGKVWMNLAPALEREQYNVWEMNYPNDQAVFLSAGLFHRQLVNLNNAGISNITVIAHSMGGLVTREMLTNPVWQCTADVCPKGKIPHVEQLIMVATPNHGSELARFRMLAEIREQAERLLAGEADWLDWIFDGAGEAGIDLIPQSNFLNSLNTRTHPVDTRYFIIAGVIGDEERQAIKTSLKDVKNHEAITTLIDNLLETIGDGLVTLESAKLENVTTEVVAGNHLSIIRNISKSSSRIPPAIPRILHLLEDSYAEQH